jgi:glycosyltransferase involved in cell wall biosynthesis
MTGKLKECNKPLVSILMNCYNGEKYLQEAVESVLAQTYQNWEIIFWDNQSEDRSAEIFKSYIDSRLNYYYAPKHTLLYEARNYALEKALGEYIAFLDVDDCWLPEKLELQVVLFDDSDVGFACSNFFIENQNKGRSSLAHKKTIQQGRVLDDLLRQYFVGLLTLVVRRSALLYSNKPFDSQYHIIGDFDLVIRLAASWKVAVIQEPLARYRIHGANESSRHRELTVIELETWCEEYTKHPVIGSSKNFHFVAYSISYCKAVNCLLSGNKMRALTFMDKMPWGRLKLRLLVGLFLPIVILKYLKN